MKKILYSPGFGGGGWSSWHNGDREQVVFMLTFGPLIEAIEAGEPIGYDEKYVRIENFVLPVDEQNDGGTHDILAYWRASCVPDSPLDKFVVAFAERFGTDDLPHLGGARDLSVTTVDRPFRITEYDGNEGVEYLNPATYINPDDLP